MGQGRVWTADDTRRTRLWSSRLQIRPPDPRVGAAPRLVMARCRNARTTRNTYRSGRWRNERLQGRHRKSGEDLPDLR